MGDRALLVGSQPAGASPVDQPQGAQQSSPTPLLPQRHQHGQSARIAAAKYSDEHSLPSSPAVQQQGRTSNVSSNIRAAGFNEQLVLPGVDAGAIDTRGQQSSSPARGKPLHDASIVAQVSAA